MRSLSSISFKTLRRNWKEKEMRIMQLNKWQKKKSRTIPVSDLDVVRRQSVSCSQTDHLVLVASDFP